ncbi:hypothetical protein VTJ83DRAFT_1639 [Remersonia thermophila]|uniref:Uncharacterized protein n=1 Tax=Remersonia thermophila TaxID=72144 RepID=A0ABR4DGJ3_9PEZI
MLSHGLAGAASSVCLQCRLRLARASRWPPSPVPRTALSTPRTAPRCFGTSPDPSADPGEHETADPETHAGTNLPSQNGRLDRDSDPSSPEPDRFSYDRPPRASPLGPRRTYKSKGHVLAPQREKLAVDILGKPGSAIVLRERFAVKKPEPTPTPIEADQNAVDPSTLLHEATPLAGEEAMRHLDGLRPKDPAPLSNADFNALIDTLIQGFTRAQLKQYLENHEMATREQKRRAAETQPWLLETQPWTPAAGSPARDVVDPHLRGYITKGMAPKKRLAVRLVRECWNVDNEDVMVGDGMLTIRLRDVEFELLTLGNKRWFEGTQRHILAQVKEVRLVRDTQRVSIVAPKHAAERIVERIHDVLSKSRTREFPADWISSEPLDPAVLQELGRMTLTVIRLDGSGKKVAVTWIHQAQRSEDFETACDTVIRLLREALGPKPRLSTALTVVPQNLAETCRYIPLHNNSSSITTKVPWHQRWKAWERWSLPIKQAYGDLAAQQAPIPASFLPFETDSVLESDPEPLASPPPDWSTELNTETTALFGHAGFARPNPVLSSSPSKLDTACPRTFLPALPALGSLQLLSNLQETGLWHTTIVIRFAPSHESPPELQISAPDLELRIDADHREIKELLGLRAIRSTFVGDVLFPAATVDARLIQHRFFTLPGAAIAARVPAIIEFLTKSNLRPWEGKMSTPRSAPGVRLPRHLFSDAPKNQHDSSDAAAAAHPAEAEASNDDWVELDYSLASIEIHRTVTGDYDGLKMRYASIQAGQRGGSHAELSLEAVRIDPDALARMVAEQQQQQAGGDASHLHPYHHANHAGGTLGHLRNSSNPITALREDLTNGPQPIPFAILSNMDQNNDPNAAWDVEDEGDISGGSSGGGGGGGGRALDDGAPWVDERRTLFEEEYAPARRVPIPVRPVKAGDFLAAVSDIVNERGPLRWHAKRFDHETTRP